MTRSRLIVVALLIATSALAVALLFRGTRRGDVPSHSNVAVSASTSAPAHATRTPATSVTTTAGASDERPTEQLISELRSSDWPTVWLAALALEAKGKRAIPPLIELLGSDEFVKLKNTADLIYPGATETYGHGFLIEYDLDWIAVRAGWVIEAITFQAFGYRQTPFRMKDGTENVAEAAKVRAAAGDRVREWWSSSSSTWTRLAGLLDGLRSGDAARQSQSLDWLRYGRTRCEGLKKAAFDQLVLPEVNKLAAASTDENVRLQAGLILERSWRSGQRSFCAKCGEDLTPPPTSLTPQGPLATCAKCGARTP